jgi:hypothetical protein
MSKTIRRGTPASKQAIDDCLALFDWGGFTGPVVMTVERLRRLIDAPAWICVEFAEDNPARKTIGLITAISAADHVIIINDLDKIDAVIGAMAAAGSKVLVFERHDGVPSPITLVGALL